MSSGGETANQVVRMSLQGIEVAANVALKAGGLASKFLAVTLYAILTDKKKMKGKATLNSMLKSGKEPKVFAMRHEDLKIFYEEAKRYSVLYSVLKEKNNTDGIVDVMVRAEDASKISRIVDKFELATVDVEAIRKSAMNRNEQLKDIPVMSDEEHDKLVSSLMDSMKKEKSYSENPTTARMKKSGHQFEHILKLADAQDITKRPSVRKEIAEIKEMKKQNKKKKTVRQRQINQPHYKKRRKRKER